MMGMGLGLPRGFNFVAAAQQMILAADYGDGAAVAFSLDYVSNTYSGDVALVRRSSDNAQLGVKPQDITGGALLGFVNTEVNKYTSDFSVSENLNEQNGTGAAAQSIGGVNEAYKFTLSGGLTSNHLTGIFGLQSGKGYRVEFDYYIPSTNAKVNGVRFRNLTPNSDNTVIDAWTSVTITTASSPSNDAFWQPLENGGTTIDADGDVFYLKNIVVTQLTADGHIVTWYDQRNGNNASQGTADRQPKIVEAGVLVTKNGKPGVKGDGVNDIMQTVAGALGLCTELSAFTVASFNLAGEANDTIWAASNGNYANSDSWIILRQASSNNVVTVNDNSVQRAVSNGVSTLDQKLRYIEYVGSNRLVHGINESDTSSTSTIPASLNLTDELDIFAFNVGGLSYTAHGAVTLQELIIYKQDMSSFRAAIREEIKQRYQMTF